MVLVGRGGGKDYRETLVKQYDPWDECDGVMVFKNNLHGGKNSVSSLPVQQAEAHGAKVCAEHLDTQPDTLPVLSDSPKR